MHVIIIIIIIIGFIFYLCLVVMKKLIRLLSTDGVRTRIYTMFNDINVMIIIIYGYMHIIYLTVGILKKTKRKKLITTSELL